MNTTTDTTEAHGYVCKRCGTASPVGIGHVAPGEEAARASYDCFKCRCGYSRTDFSAAFREDMKESCEVQRRLLAGPDRADEDVLLGHAWARARLEELERLLSQ